MPSDYPSYHAYILDQLLPKAVVFGFGYRELMDMTPAVVRGYTKGYEKKIELIDDYSYNLGKYFYIGIMTAFANVLDKNGKHEYPDKPFHELALPPTEIELSEEEILEQTNRLFASLNLMKANFERTNPKSGN